LRGNDRGRAGGQISNFNIPGNAEFRDLTPGSTRAG
jgi:hypothetical protein